MRKYDLGNSSVKPGSSETRWEDICSRCGLCCFEKYEDESGTIFFTSRACRYLDLHSRECKVYERRFAVNPDCIQLTPELVEKLDWLHDDCAYRKAIGIKRKRSFKGK